MDFFRHQEHARTNTRRLVVLFAIAVLLIILAVNLTLSLIFSSFITPNSPMNYNAGGPQSAEFFFWVSSFVFLTIAAGTYYRTTQLNKGAEHLAIMLGATKVLSTTEEPKERMLLNVVEEMSIAAGSPIPNVYIQKRENSINALAAGWDPRDAFICVTQGCLDNLSRDELQGVVAHELSHILNRDIQLNLRLVGVLFGILCISKIGWLIMRLTPRSRGNSRGGGGAAIAIFILGVALLAVGYIGVVFGRIIRAATSRQREFLADAFAVQLTRNPDGLGGAFRKIKAQSEAPVRDMGTEEVSHMFFSQSFQRPWLNLMATHPPLDERIQRLGVVLNMASSHMSRHTSQEPPSQGPETPSTPFPTGEPSNGLFTFFSAGLLTLDESLKEASHSEHEAKAIILAIALSKAENPSELKEKIPTLDFGKEVNSYFYANYEQIGALPSNSQNTLLSLCSASLRDLLPPEKSHFLQQVKSLIYLDDKMDVQEWALLAFLEKRLQVDVHESVDGKSTLGQSLRSVRLLFTVLADFSPDDTLTSYQKGWMALGMAPLDPTPKNQRHGEGLLQAMDELKSLRPGEQKKLLQGMILISSSREKTLSEEQTFFIHSVLHALDISELSWEEALRPKEHIA